MVRYVRKRSVLIGNKLNRYVYLHERAADLGVHLVGELLLEVLDPLLHILTLSRVFDGSKPEVRRS